MMGLASALLTAAPEEWGFEVVEDHPQDRGAFTQGLYYDHEGLVLGTGQYGRSSIRRVRLRTGNSLLHRKLDGRLFGEGVARHGATLFQLTWKAGVVLKYDAATLKPRGTLRYRGEGWGLTSDGKVLIMSNGSSVLTGRDPKSFAPIWDLKVTLHGRPLTALNELEFIGGKIFANVWQSNQIVVIDPLSGVVSAIIDCSGLVARAQQRQSGAGVLNGIAYDAQRKLLLVTGKNWDVIHALRLTGSK
jgi:glutamine cyclotransferase